MKFLTDIKSEINWPKTIALSTKSDATWSIEAKTRDPNDKTKENCSTKTSDYFFYIPMPKNIRDPTSKKIFSAYVGFDFESMHLNEWVYENVKEKTIGKYNWVKVCHDNVLHCAVSLCKNNKTQDTTFLLMKILRSFRFSRVQLLFLLSYRR